MLQQMVRTTADTIGMIATVINALALQESLEKIGCAHEDSDCHRDESEVAEPFIHAKRALQAPGKRAESLYLQVAREILISPTDTTAALQGS